MNEKRKNAVLRSFGASVRKHRRMAGLSQEACADLCELDRSYLGGVERGERNLTLAQVVKICDSLKVNVTEMLADLDKKWPKKKEP